MGKSVNLIAISVFFLISFIFMSGLCFADEADTIEQAFSNAKIKGTIGSYFEFTAADAADSDFGWAAGYISLKYETQSWNRFNFGARFFAHGQLYSDHDNGTSDPFETDIESPYTLPEVYLARSFADASSITIGRWAHEKISHIDDGQSEGGYLSIKEIPELELIAGVMTRFAEIDYDDGEDFGRINKSQDLDSESVYGYGSKPYLLFIEGKYKPCDLLKFNPYFMSQDGYAAVYGLDTKIENQMEDSQFSYGGEINYYHVSSDISDSSDSNNFAVFPYILKDNLEITIGYAKFDDGDSLNKPIWLRDYCTLLDQQKEYGVAGSEKYFAKIKIIIDKFWTHFAYGDNNYDFLTSRGDRAEEYELQFGYNLTKNLDLNLRLFDVRYDNVEGNDYQKVESRIRFKF